MCTKTVRSFTNARYISKVYPQKVVSYWKCGFCSECIAEKRSEFKLRAYYEAKRCISQGGFVLFDTLTYRDQCLKYFSDYYPAAIGQPWNFCAFSRSDIRSFFQNLNLTLTRLGYDIAGKFVHLLTSEYGSRPDCSHRPHYHVLFFVNFPIEPEILSYIIGEVWSLGRTDGIWYKGRRYLLYQRVFRSLDRDLLKVSNYVAKYVGKDLHLHRVLMRRCVRSFYQLYPNWTQYSNLRLEFRRFCANVLPFHLQSDGFGSYALQDVPIDDIVSFDSLPLPLSGPGIVARIPLPLYFRRKLFYRLECVEGRNAWVLTDFGRRHMVETFSRRVDQFASKIKSFDYKSPADELARYHLLRRGLLLDKLSSVDDCDLLDRLYHKPVDHSFLKDNGLFFYGVTTKCACRRESYVSDVEFTGFEPFDRCLVRNLEQPAQVWSPAEFVSHPPDGFVVYSEPDKDLFLDSFFSWLRENGDSFDFVNERIDRHRDHLKKIGFLDEFSLD